VTLLTPLDTGFLRMESSETPMHVGAVEIFVPPPEEEATFVRDVTKAFYRQSYAKPPFSLRLADTPWQALLPSWQEVGRLDLDYHLRRWALPSPGTRRELDELVSYLHTECLDRKQPLWQMHLIEGLPGGRLAIYTKVHHSLLDGVGGARLLQSVLSEDCDRCNLPPPWAPTGWRRNRVESPRRHGFSDLGHLLDLAAVRMRTLPGLYGALSGVAKAAISSAPNPLTAPFRDEKTLLNGKIGRNRRCNFRTLSLERMRASAHRADVTVNDVFLSICGGALRRYLGGRNALLAQPLTAMVPVSVRPEGDDSHGNAVSFVLASLATDIEEPRERLAPSTAPPAPRKRTCSSYRQPGSASTPWCLHCP
jgi:WS/DGAT/MGAT family acyltransferase